jgi:hypothetical protein
MVQRVLCQIAGIDRQTLSSCPATDKLWASQLAFSLLLSFLVVFGITFHATGYVITSMWLRLLAATVIALTVFMFDRALYQSDWFYQGALAESARQEESNPRRSVGRFVRIGIRLTISFGLAWVIAVFLELAIFSDTINDKIKRDHIGANREIFQKIEGHETRLDAEIAQRRRNLAAAEVLYRSEMSAPALLEFAALAPVDDHEQQIRRLDAQDQSLRTELRQLGEKVTAYAEEMNAEQLGRRLNASSSGRSGTGPRYQFAKQQKEVYEAQRAERERELTEVRAKREELRAIQREIAAEVLARRNQGHSTVQSRRDALSGQVDVARMQLKELETSRTAMIEEFRRQATSASEFQKQKDDPLSRMTAYQELKNDPQDGATITLFSWMTKFVIIFLEIVPVVAKLFFSPPSVYAAKIQAQVERQRFQLERGEASVDRLQPMQQRSEEFTGFQLRAPFTRPVGDMKSKSDIGLEDRRGITHFERPDRTQAESPPIAPNAEKLA